MGVLRIIAISFGCLVLIFGIWLVERLYKRSCLWGMAIMGIVSGIIGKVLGAGAQLLYNPFIAEGDSEIAATAVPNTIGALAGIVFGVLVGIIFVAILRRPRFQHSRRLVPATCYGMLAGITCSTLVHATLMINYKNFDFQPMLVGALFGLVAGLILGFAEGLVPPNGRLI